MDLIPWAGRQKHPETDSVFFSSVVMMNYLETKNFIYDTSRIHGPEEAGDLT